MFSKSVLDKAQVFGSARCRLAASAAGPNLLEFVLTDPMRSDYNMFQSDSL